MAADASVEPSYFRDRIAPWGLVFLVFLVYWPALRGSFVWDDQWAVRDNPLLLGGRGLWAVWTSVGAIPAESHYWPLTYTALWIEHALFGWRTAGFHAVNLLLHAGISIQLWRLMRRAGMPGALLAASIFALHPIHVEAAAWITEIKELLAAGFGLLAVEASLRYEARPGRGALIGSGLAMAAAMLAKSSAVVLPAGIALLAWSRRGKLGRREAAGLAPAAAVAFVFAAADWAINASLDSSAAIPPPLGLRLATAGEALWFYAGKFLWPVHLSAIYPQFAVDPGKAAAWMPLAGAIGLAGLLWGARGRIGRGPLACWLFYAIALGPVLGILHFSFLDVSPIADRYQYLASLGPIAGAGVLLGRGLERLGGGTRRAAWGIVAAGMAFLGWQTFQDAGMFRSQTALFSNAAKIAPDSFYASFNAASGLYGEGRLDEACAMLENAYRIDPVQVATEGSYGLLLTRLGRDAEAAAVFRRGLAAKPNDADALAALAWVLATSSDPKVRDLQEALALARRSMGARTPGNFKQLDALAAAQAATGDFSGAAASATLARESARAAGAGDEAQQIDARLKDYLAGRDFRRER